MVKIRNQIPYIYKNSILKMNNKIDRFSKLDKNKKIDWLINNHFNSKKRVKKLLKSYWNSDKKIQKNHDEFSENTISNFYYPLGVAPNFLINKKAISSEFWSKESWPRHKNGRKKVMTRHKTGLKKVMTPS